MKNQLQITRERNSKVIKEKNLLIDDLKDQLSQVRDDMNELKLHAPLKQENDKLRREMQEKTKKFHETQNTLERRISELIAEKNKFSDGTGTSISQISFKILLSSPS